MNSFKYFCSPNLIDTMNHAFKWEQYVIHAWVSNLAFANFVYPETWGTWSKRNCLQWLSILARPNSSSQMRKYLQIQKITQPTCKERQTHNNLYSFRKIFQYHRFVEAQFNDFFLMTSTTSYNLKKNWDQFEL